MINGISMKFLSWPVVLLVGFFFTFGAGADDGKSHRAEIVAELAKKHGEVRSGMGLGDNGGVIELFTNTESGTWTLIMTMPNGQSFFVGSGEHWENQGPVLDRPIRYRGGESGGIQLIAAKEVDKGCAGQTASEQTAEFQRVFGIDPVYDLQRNDYIKFLSLANSFETELGVRALVWVHQNYVDSYFVVVYDRHDCDIGNTAGPQKMLDDILK